MSVMDIETPAQSIEGFLEESCEKDTPGGAFEAESDRMLRIEVDGGVWLKPGAAIAYRGEISFERLHTLDARSLRDAAMREMSPLVRARGRGRLYCGHRGLHVRLVRLKGQSIFVAWNDVLAFEDSLEFETSLVASGVGLAAGGLSAVKLSGWGAVAIASHGRPLTLYVAPEHPVSTDPHATLAWSGNLGPVLKMDVNWRSVIGHGGQQPVQMFFEGCGFVVVQPYKDASRFAVKIDPLKRIKSLLLGA